MEDLTEKITEILSDPDAVNNLQNIAGLLGLSSKEQGENQEKPSQKRKQYFFYRLYDLLQQKRFA